MSEYDLEDKGKEIPTKEEIYRVVYRRRGSDLILGATSDNEVQISRVNHRFKTVKSYLHKAEDVSAARDSIKSQIEIGGYKLISSGPATGLPKHEDK